MPVIAFATSKGGAGKSTSALLMATQLAEAGHPVTVLDCDQQGWLQFWHDTAAKQGRVPPNITIETVLDEGLIIEAIDAAQQKTPFVLIDLEGTANMLVSFAISRADLVVIPMQASGMDAKAAAKSVNLVRQQERAFNRTIPMAVVFTRTNPVIRTDLQNSLRRQLESAKVRVFKVEIFERVAFKEMFNKGASLESLLELQPKKVKAIKSAIENAKSFAGETVGILKENAAPNNQTSSPTTERIAA